MVSLFARDCRVSAQKNIRDVNNRREASGDGFGAGDANSADLLASFFFVPAPCHA